MTNVNGTSIKIDMPTSQYGVLYLNGHPYNVHIINFRYQHNKVGRLWSTFQIEMLGQPSEFDENLTWEDSYEAI